MIELLMKFFFGGDENKQGYLWNDVKGK